MIGLDLGGLGWARSFANKDIDPLNTIKTMSDCFLFRPLTIIEVLRPHIKSDDNRTESGWVLVGQRFC